MSNDDLYEYTVNFDKIMKIFEGAANDMLDANPIRERTATYQFNIQGSGDLLTKDGKLRDKSGRLSTGQRAALGKMHEPYVKKWLAKAEKETRDVCDRFLNDYAATQGGKSVWLLGISASEKAKATKELTREVTEIRRHYVNKIYDRIEADLKSYRAGRARKLKIIGQGTKHVAKPVLKLAGAPLAIMTTPPPLVPIAVMLTIKGLILETKDTLDFFNAKYRDMDRLEKSIVKHLNIFMERATQAQGKASSAKQKLLPRNVAKEMDDDEVIIRELRAIAMMDLFSVHKKSVANLELIMGKYQKCMDKSRYLALRSVKKIEKMEANLASLEKSGKAFAEYSVKLDRVISDVDAKLAANATPQLQRALAGLLKELAKNKEKLKKVKSGIAGMEALIAKMKGKSNKLFDKFMQRDLAFHQYKKDLKRLNRSMPDKLGAYKTILEMALAVMHMAELGVSIAGDTLNSVNLMEATSIDPSAISELSTILTKCAMTAGYSQTAFDELGDILNGGGDIRTLLQV